ncbi:MAG: BBP7 family outer membrane beta-barrel protein, partial [Planctomycetes bacterium]|nr:BBP7 family outer membrane beta-barrel protein [Planctomycetota bacterium]
MMLRRLPTCGLLVAVLLSLSPPAAAQPPRYRFPSQAPSYSGSVFPVSLNETVASAVDATAVVAHEESDESAPAVSVESDAHVCSASTCCGAPWIWGRAEYLHWWTDGMGVPALVTTSLDGTLQDQAGVLGEPNTSVLFGDSGLNGSARSGGRFTLGMWIDPCRRRGLEVSYSALAEETETFDASDADFAILARPFFNVQPRDETGDILPARSDARLIVFDGIVEGSVAVDAKTGFEELEILLRQAVYQGGAIRVDFLVGYQFSYLNDELWIEEFTESLDQDNVAVPVGTTIELFDLFDTSKKFHGAALGLV